MSRTAGRPRQRATRRGAGRSPRASVPRPRASSSPHHPPLQPSRALDGLSLQGEAGEVFGFLGPNGAGKTTTLKLLLQLVFPTSGDARILGRPPGDVDAKRRLGYLPENPYFYDYLTAEELLT